MRTVTRVLVALVLVAAAGCGGDPGAFPLVFDLRSQTAWVQRADAQQRLFATADRAARFWGATGNQDMAGWLVIVQDGTIECGGGVDLGCTYFSSWPWGRIVLSAAAGEAWLTRCAEQTLLAHEVGHAILDTPSHEDPRWSLLPAWQMADVAAQPDCL